MQSLAQKFPLKLLIFFLFQPQLIFSQEVEKKIFSADSLFNAKNYTQAFTLYEDLYKNDGLFSPQMLIKMAFVQEARGQYSETLYYLNKYYLLTNDKNAREKIEEIAEKHKLTGYEYSDFKFVLNLLRFYQLQITFFFVLFVSVMVVWIGYQYLRFNSKLISPAIITIILLLCFQILNYLIRNHTEGIISDTTFLMEGPSAAADISQTVKEGNRVVVLEEDDIWLKVSLDDKQGYVKKNHLLLLNP